MAVVNIREQPPGEPGEAYAFQHVIWAHALSGVLLAATELDLFTALDQGPATAAQAAARCGALPRWTEKLLTACAAMGLVERTGELAHRVRTGGRGPNEARAAHDPAARPAAHRTWIRAMHNIAMAGQAAALAGALDLADRRRLIDVGGGPGTYAVELCRRYPQLRAVVLDLPETEPAAGEVIDSSGLADRVRFRAGDYLHDDYGEGNDVVLCPAYCTASRSRTAA